MILKNLRLILLLFITLYASTLQAIGSAGVTPLFSLGAGGRALGMGGANVALANDAAAVFWNPAALTSLPSRSLSVMYLPLPEGTNYSFAAIGWPTVDYGSFSLAAFLITTDKIERRDANGRLLGEFGANQQMYLVGYGKQINRFLAFGATLKLVGESFDNVSSYGAGGDLGIKASVSEHLALGFNAQNLLAPEIRLNRDSEKLPVTFKAGAGITVPFSSDRNHLVLEFDLDKTKNVDPVFHVGAELAFLRNYFIRGGYDVDQISIGAGLRVGPASLDYVYRTQDFFEAQHRISLDLSFGGSLESILAKREEDNRRAAEQLADEQRSRDLSFAQSQARQFYGNGNYDSALVYFQKVSVLTSGSDKEAGERLAEIEKEHSDRLTATVRAGVLAENDSLKAEELLAELSEAITLKDWESASLLIGRLRPAFGNDPRFRAREADYVQLVTDRVAALHRDATRLANEGKLAEAALCYDEIIRVNSSDAVARRNLKTISDRIVALSLLRSGMAAFSLGDTVLAQQTLEKLLTASPNDSVAIGLLQLIGAEASSSTAASLAEIQKDSGIWKTYLEGIERFRQGDYEQAIKLWRQVLTLYPGQIETEKNIQQAKLRLQADGKTD
jgi:tetratricopeptide (TPR) repeat protein